ncbi:SPASM domain peptide maturase, grasp-with-spasm system [Chryseobacterium arachidis]|uniref:SPASM domain peptide maturase, grasp-with-spasm system n=1 Tax=Chryseobacterium arachidis TaxID=1416778 RepID=A0A1M5CSB7_9FLAO|nr:grasp-with-spasm system SPASM domain peptide maturase [Chryseobacterium arachidis]SHF57517.1 SPASM domain peptide maturase, grasp-with-spasm system [Chryseobacterium arachidis]
MRYFNLFSDILITKGASRILISDLQRNISEVFPLEFFHVIEELKTKSIEQILSRYDIESKLLFEEYIEFFLEEEYGFISYNDWDKNFVPYSFSHHEPSKINNIFLELDDFSIFEKIKQSIENLGVQYLSICSSRKILIKEILEIESIFDGTSLEGIEIYCPYHEEINDNSLKALDKSFKRIYNLVFYNCNVKFHDFNEDSVFNFTEDNLNIKKCGIVDLKYFSTNIPKIIESKNYNSCLFKKVGIDSEGNIKNCPAFEESYGNIYKNSLEDIVKIQGFKKYWNITKNEIEICKDCEFRYICTDCRAYTEKTHINKDGLDISKPLKCGYNPYTGEWEEWSLNPLKQMAIKYYDMYGLLKID